MIYKTFKRICDIILSLTGLIISFPVWVLSAILTVMESGGPVLITQERFGKNCNIMHLIKFRSMDKQAHKESPINHITNHRERVTNVGRLLRITAMDELPQLLLILTGKMSFVGPRPIHKEETTISESKFEAADEIPDFKKRCSIRPGLTGLAQVYAERDIPIEDKIKYDMLYIKKMNFFLDLKLIILSFWRTFRGKWGS